MTSFRLSARCALFSALGLGAFLLGCDQVSRPETGQPPTVSGLTVSPDSVNVADLPPDQVNDSAAVVGIRIAAEVEDPDGSVVRVEFTFEPASTPEGTVTGPLNPATDSLYDQRIGLQLPRVDEVYTVRVFAVDDDSLASNQGVARFRLETE